MNHQSNIVTRSPSLGGQRDLGRHTSFDICTSIRSDRSEEECEAVVSQPHDGHQPPGSMHATLLSAPARFAGY